MRRLPALVLAVVTCVALALIAVGVWAVAVDEPTTTHRIVIAAGTGDRIDGGADVEVFPTRYDVAYGDRLVLRNDDDRVHVVGPWVVGPGETVRQTFDEITDYEGLCTLNGAGTATVVVRYR